MRVFTHLHRLINSRLDLVPEKGPFLESQLHERNSEVADNAAAHLSVITSVDNLRKRKREERLM
jgi:hypothetical protein